jgi:hypothetical protein
VKDRGLAEQAQAPCSSSCDQPLNDADLDDNNTSTPDVWDPHMGLKPLALNDCISDADIEVEDVLPYGAESEINGEMINMMADLDDHDT